MRKFATLSVLGVFLAQTAVIASEVPPPVSKVPVVEHNTTLVAREGTLRAAATREVARLISSDRDRSSPVQGEQQRSERSAWIGRHPALFGAIVGAGVGTVAAFTLENELFCSGGDEDCLIYGGTRAAAGAGMGAGVGALVGFVVGVARK